MKTYHSIGKNPTRFAVSEKLQGKPAFCADIPLENALELRVLRSPHKHALIKKIDAEEACKIKGVVRVFTAGDIPGKNLTGIINKDRPLLVAKKVRFEGDAVALVAAENEVAAEQALSAIRVDYEELPFVIDPEEALKEGAPHVHDDGNLLFTRKIRKGNVESAFQKSHLVIEKTYHTAALEHTYLEPDAGVGYVDTDGSLVIMASTQNPHYDRGDVATLLDMEKEKVRIIQAATGGGFGSKLDLNVQGFIGLALYHLKRPVRYVFSREEAFLATAKRHPLKMTLKTGVDRDGKLLAMKARIVCDTGAYASYGLAVASRAPVHATGPYEVEHFEADCLCVYTNNPFGGAMRGFGVPQIAFAHESQMDAIAEALSIDPLEIRRFNCLKIGSRMGTGQELKASAGMGDCLDAVEKQYQRAVNSWRSVDTSPFKRRGVGVGAMFYGIGNTGVKNPSTAQIEMNEDGTITLFTGCADIGQGSTTVFAQIAAEELNLPIDAIKVIAADTKFTTSAGATSASRQTYISGNAVREAAENLRELLIAQGADLLKIPAGEVVLDSGFVRDGNGGEKKAGFSQIAREAKKNGVSLHFEGAFDPDTVPLDPETGQGVPYATYAFACHVALVEADVATGEVRVEKIIAAHDVGRALYPESVRGQILGGVAMGVGFALMEEYVPGETESMKDYYIPTSADMPEVEPIIVECPEPTGPFGAKGVGEPALIPTAPAILNALSDALGERILSLPANLERVLEAGAQIRRSILKERKK